MKVFLTKPALLVYVGLAVLIATAFGFGEEACSLAENFDLDVEVCAQPVEAE